jgi:hypothetical protein
MGALFPRGGGDDTRGARSVNGVGSLASCGYAKPLRDHASLARASLGLRSRHSPANISGRKTIRDASAVPVTVGVGLVVHKI